MARGQKATPRGEWSPERKETQNAWKREKRATISATVDKETAAAFRALCSARGLSVNAAVTALIESCIASGDLVQLSAAGSGDRHEDDRSEKRDDSAAVATRSVDLAGITKNGGDQAKTTHTAPCSHHDSPSDCTNYQDFPSLPCPGGSRARPGVGNSRVPVVPRDNVPPAGPAAPAPAQDQVQAPAQPSTRTHTGNRRTPTHPQVHAPASECAPAPGEKTALGNSPAEDYAEESTR